MKVSRILLTGCMRMNNTLPVKEILNAFEDQNTEEVQVILAGSGMYDADSSLALVELVEGQHRKTGKKVTTHLLTSIGIIDFFVWLRCGINGRTMRSTARVWIKLPKWSRFSSCWEEAESPDENEQRFDVSNILERINEYITLTECDGKYLNVMNLDEFGLLQESYLHLMEQRNYGVAL
jgi:hypothetical protein